MATPTDIQRVYGLIGYPLSHSFSSTYFNQKFRAEHIPAQYINFEIDDVNQLMEILSEQPLLAGLNVTAPYKEQVIPFLTSLDPDAEAIGAVNVIRITRDEHSGEVVDLRGFNSDVVGFGRSIEPLLTDAHKSAMVLGTGGAAKAVTAALRKLGVEVQPVSRHKNASTITYEEITKAMVGAHQIVVNATPLGKYPKPDECPDFPYRFLTPNHLCYDLIYNPAETTFMRKSADAGAQTKNGLEMLLLQAFVSYEIWTEGRADVI